MKTAIFVIGDYGSGKSSIVRALTGVGGRRTPMNNPYLLDVRTLSGRKIKALVIKSALQEDDQTRDIPPHEFPEAFERVVRYRVRPDAYELLICPLEISDYIQYTFDQYLTVFISKGIDVRVAVIERSWDNETPSQNELQRVQDFVTSNSLTHIGLNVYDSDTHLGARRIRDSLYPQ